MSGYRPWLPRKSPEPHGRGTGCPFFSFSFSPVRRLLIVAGELIRRSKRRERPNISMHSDHDDAECIRHVIPEPGSLSVPCLSVSDLFYYLVLLLHNLTLLAEMCVCVWWKRTKRNQGSKWYPLSGRIQLACSIALVLCKQLSWNLFVPDISFLMSNLSLV